jgi:hypothetical protein
MKTLSLTFDLPLRHADLPAFRGAFAAMAGHAQDLFHNHDNQAGSTRDYHHRYPLVQYRVHDGHAAILGINEGAEAIGRLHRAQRFGDFSLQGRRMPLQVAHSRLQAPAPALIDGEGPQRYRLYHYLPFTPENYQQYKTLPSLSDKVPFLERILQNHIVAMARGTGCDLPDDAPLAVRLQDIDRVKKVNALGTPMMAFDLVFTAQARLPEGIGLGRKVAFGFGFSVPLGK